MTIITPQIHQLMLAAEIARLCLLRVVEHEAAERLRQARARAELDDAKVTKLARDSSIARESAERQARFVERVRQRELRPDQQRQLCRPSDWIWPSEVTSKLPRVTWSMIREAERAKAEARLRYDQDGGSAFLDATNRLSGLRRRVKRWGMACERRIKS
jgi:hypothetical protein